MNDPAVDNEIWRDFVDRVADALRRIVRRGGCSTEYRAYVHPTYRAEVRRHIPETYEFPIPVLCDTRLLPGQIVLRSEVVA